MNAPRRSSLGMLLRRSKSGDLGKGSKKEKALKEQELARQREAVSKNPPRLPVLYNGAPAPQFQGFGGGPGNPVDPRTNMVARQDQTPRASMDPGYRSPGNYPVPPVPNGSWVDPYARTESMTHRGRYSYASSAISTINSPRRVRRRKDPTPFNILIVGTRGAGKTSFLEFLKISLALPPKKRMQRTMDMDDFTPRPPPSGNFIPHYLETEIDGERIGLTLWDSEGLEKNVVDLQLRDMSAFLESKFEETFNEEMKVVRSPGVQDTHIHAVFLILDPTRLDRNITAVKALMAAAAAANGANNVANSGGANGHPYPMDPVAAAAAAASASGRMVGILDEDLDLQVLRTLQGKTTVIPVIAKADTITSKHMTALKRSVWESLKKANLDPLKALGLEDDADSGRIDEADEDDEDEDAAGGHNSGLDTPDPEELPIQGHDGSPASKRLSANSIRRKQAEQEGVLKDDEVPFIPMSILSPDVFEPGVIGRQFPWGFADPYNEDHCDFLRLKDAVFSEWRGELREASREQWYEGWRTSRLKIRDPVKGRR